MKTCYRSACRFFLPLLAVVAALSGESRVSPPRAETLRSAPEGFFNLLTLPTEATPISRAHVEWDPAQALLLSVSLRDFLQNEDDSSFYLECIELATRYVPVVIAYDVADTRYLAQFEGVLFDHPIVGIRRERILFAPTRSRSIWIRDNGPIFAFDLEGQLIVLDSIYRSLEAEIESYSNLSLDVDSKDLAYDLAGFVDYR